MSQVWSRRQLSSPIQMSPKMTHSPTLDGGVAAARRQLEQTQVRYPGLGQVDHWGHLCLLCCRWGCEGHPLLGHRPVGLGLGAHRDMFSLVRLCVFGDLEGPRHCQDPGCRLASLGCLLGVRHRPILPRVPVPHLPSPRPRAPCLGPTHSLLCSAGLAAWKSIITFCV